MKTNPQIKCFFEYISLRKRSENDLSDFTWAMCNTSNSFKSIFLNFFFPDVEFNSITLFEREKSELDSRPDFLIVNDGITYLIECKLYDCNHHFEQYTTTFKIPNTQLGYITNYNMLKEGFVVHTWEELLDVVISNLPDNEYEAQLWLGYAEYLKNVCSIVKITKKMERKGMYSLYAFNKILSKLTEREEAKFKLSFYSNKNIHNYFGVSGIYFKIEYLNAKINDTWAWIGVYFNREEPIICMGFESKEGWGKPVFDIMKNASVEKQFFKRPYQEDNSIWFELTEKKHFEFDNSDLENQVQILKGFMDEVITYPITI